MLEHKQFGIKEMADLLEMRKRNNHRTVLLLGSRAGCLFRSEHFYETLQKFSHRGFHNLSPSEQFGECYNILSKTPFSETEIHSLLRASLQDLTIMRADACLANLIRNGHFDEIISTNIDGGLEQSLVQIGMKEHKDFEVFIPTRAVFHEKSLSCRIVKVFGDFSLRVYTVKGRRSHLEGNQPLQNALQRVLARDLLIIGLDPTWDGDIFRLLPGKADTLCFVNEEDLRDHELIAPLLQERRAYYVQTNYDNFIRELFDHLYGAIVPFNYQLGQDILNQLSDMANQLRGLQDGHKILLNEIQHIHNKMSNCTQQSGEY